MSVQSNPTLAQVIANFTSATTLALQWTQGDATTVVSSPGGNYPSLAKLTKDTQDALAAFYVNPAFTGKAGFTPPVGATADREPNPTVGRTRYNSSLATLETFTTKGWLPVPTRLLAAYSGSVGVVSGTTRIPWTTAAPTITAGTQLWSKQVTPTVVGSVMQIQFSCYLDSTDKNAPTTLAIFRDNTLLGFTVVGEAGGGNNQGGTASLTITDTTTSLTAVTYSCRVGNNNTGTWYVGKGQTNTQGGVNNAGWFINEVLPS